MYTISYLLIHPVAMFVFDLQRPSSAEHQTVSLHACDEERNRKSGEDPVAKLLLLSRGRSRRTNEMNTVSPSSSTLRTRRGQIVPGIKSDSKGIKYEVEPDAYLAGTHHRVHSDSPLL